MLPWFSGDVHFNIQTLKQLTYAGMKINKKSAEDITHILRNNTVLTSFRDSSPTCVIIRVAFSDTRLSRSLEK